MQSSFEEHITKFCELDALSSSLTIHYVFHFVFCFALCCTEPNANKRKILDILSGATRILPSHCSLHTSINSNVQTVQYLTKSVLEWWCFVIHAKPMDTTISFLLLFYRLYVSLSCSCPLIDRQHLEWNNLFEYVLSIRRQLHKIPTMITITCSCSDEASDRDRKNIERLRRQSIKKKINATIGHIRKAVCLVCDQNRVVLSNRQNQHNMWQTIKMEGKTFYQ